MRATKMLMSVVVVNYSSMVTMEMVIITTEMAFSTGTMLLMVMTTAIIIAGTYFDFFRS